ncbi:uncharacterized protein VTP21DRAFT_9197 [Calcarisporiella thermophila]|uniref:uncharacterized protein n=1 Tax=Calcarisporiella thermophila TaxID=911321 RepID=UPI00374267D8
MTLATHLIATLFFLSALLSCLAAPLNTTIGTSQFTMENTCNADVTTMDAKKKFGKQRDLGVTWSFSLPFNKWQPAGPPVPIIVDGHMHKFNHLIIIATTLSLDHVGQWEIPGPGFATVDDCQGGNKGATLVTTNRTELGPQVQLVWHPPKESDLGVIQFFSCVASIELEGYQCWASDGIEEEKVRPTIDLLDLFQ